MEGRATWRPSRSRSLFLFGLCSFISAFRDGHHHARDDACARGTRGGLSSCLSRHRSSTNHAVSQASISCLCPCASRSSRRPRWRRRVCGVDGGVRSYLLNACVPYLLAVQNIYASAKRRGVRFHGPMETTDAVVARSRIATGSVWQYMREHDQLFTAEEIRLAVRVEFEAARNNDINWWNYEEDAGADAPADVEDIVVDIGDDEHDSDQDSDATNHSLASEYLRQFDEGEISEGESD